MPSPNEFSAQTVLSRAFDPTNNRINTNISALLSQANAWSALQTFNDGRNLALGTDNDIVLMNRATTLAADTSLANVLIGTPISEALAANSLIISNITAAGDLAFYGNRGGNSEQCFFYDSSTGVLYLMANFGGILLGLGADPPVADQAGVHIFNATATGAVTAQAGTILTLEGGGNIYLTFKTPNTADNTGIIWADNVANAGQFLYNHSVNQFRYLINGGNSLFYSAGAFAFQEATTVSATSGNNLTIEAIGVGNLVLRANAVSANWPTAVGTAGQQLQTDGAAPQVLSWAAAGSLRKVKDIHGQGNAQNALDKMLNTKVYRYHYRPDVEGPTTRDFLTEYWGPTADEAPWAMHHDGSILNPINAFGYTVLAFQAMQAEIDALRAEVVALKGSL